MRKLTASLVMFLVFGFTLGCGGGGSGGGGGGCDIDSLPDIRGDYQLTWFEVDGYDGPGCSDYVVTLTPDYFDSWSGTMTIGDTTITQTVTVDGGSETNSGTYTLTCTSETTGIFHITDGSGTHNVPFTLDGPDLTTDSGCIDVTIDTINVSLVEYDTWTKIGDYASGRVAAQAQSSSAVPLGALGGALALP